MGACHVSLERSFSQKEVTDIVGRAPGEILQEVIVGPIDDARRQPELRKGPRYGAAQEAAGPRVLEKVGHPFGDSAQAPHAAGRIVEVSFQRVQRSQLDQASALIHAEQRPLRSHIIHGASEPIPGAASDPHADDPPLSLQCRYRPGQRGLGHAEGADELCGSDGSLGQLLEESLGQRRSRHEYILE